MKLVIFDMDQTLVDLIPVHDRATMELFRTLYGKEAKLTEIDFAGKNLADNLIELGVMKGIPAETLAADGPALLRQYEAIFVRSVPIDSTQYVLPGAKELLEDLSRTDDFVVLYTGSSKGVVDAVFAATGLDRYLRFTVYGTDAPSRAGMLRRAVERASAIAGRQFVGKDVVVVGDSVRDVEAGKEIGALTVAVATGFHSRPRLVRAGPDYLFESLADYRSVIEAIHKNATAVITHADED